QFVVITLIADTTLIEGMEDAAAAFASPNIVHFSAALFVSAALSAPWQGTTLAAIIAGLPGVAGLIYEFVVVRRMLQQKGYAPVMEDGLFNMFLPILAYAALTGSALLLRSAAHEALFGFAAAALLLLFIGIHNAWDAVTYHVFVARRRLKK